MRESIVHDSRIWFIGCMFDGLMTDDPFVLPQTVSTPMPFQSSTRVIGWALLQVQNNVAPLRLYTKLCPLEILTIKNQQCHFSTHMIYQSIYIYIILYIYHSKDCSNHKIYASTEWMAWFELAVLLRPCVWRMPQYFHAHCTVKLQAVSTEEHPGDVRLLVATWYTKTFQRA